MHSLTDPFATDYPSFLEVALLPPPVHSKKDASLEKTSTSDGEQGKKRGRKRHREKPVVHGEITVCGAFSDQGGYMLMGCVSGRIVIRDMLTHSVATIQKCHNGIITSVSYLSNLKSRYIMTTSTDGWLKVFDLEGFSCKVSLNLGKPIGGASVSRVFDGCQKKACVVGFCDDENDPKAKIPWPVIFGLDLGEDAMAGTIRLKRLRWEPENKELKKRPKCVVSVFNKSGSFIFVGGWGGDLHVFDATTMKEVGVESPLKKTKQGWVTSMVISGNGHILLMQISDKVIHMLRVEGERTLVHVRDFQNSVENTKWLCCTVSNDGEYVIGGCAKSHQLHVWNILGRHMCTLNAPDRDGVRDVFWHPTRPLVVSFGKDGQMNIWAAHRSQSWSAFAPNFVQLDENQEYHEREDEFDKNPRESIESKPNSTELVQVDITTLNGQDVTCLDLDEYSVPLNLAPTS
mmetsp:Transcript_6420/g.11106  ORF Transcript_6420/g.11106 Transcript_6420/m.11106 type:complete len:459 (+) Transcript_6420:1988-3364(+)